MTQCFRRKESAVEPVCILATAVFAVLAAAGVAVSSIDLIPSFSTSLPPKRTSASSNGTK